MIRFLSLLTFILVGTMGSKPLQAKGFDRGAPEKTRSVPFTLRWKKLRLAEMLFSISGENDEYWQISGRTLGPLRLVKNYEGEAKQRYDTNGQKYRLEGRDQGFLENREILFRSGYLPLVVEFVDRTAETFLTPELSWGKSAISPMGLFRQIMNSASAPSSCNGSFTVYDGKRGYTVKLNGRRAREKELLILDLPQSKERVYWNCSAILDSHTLIQGSKDLDAVTEKKLEGLGTEEKGEKDIVNDLRWSKVWFFGLRDRRVDFILSADCAIFELAGMLISSPIGQIVGKSSTSCILER